MKKFYSLILFLMSFFSFSQTSQLGIGTLTPTEMLDVNGAARIRKTDDIGNDSYKILVKSDTGVVKELDKSAFVVTTERKEITVKPNQSVLVTNDQIFESANIIILSTNTCGRYMLGSFQSFKGALVFLNGVGRDVMALATLINIPSNGVAYSASWRITYPNMIDCAANGSEHFNFTLLKTNNNTYQITNNGKEARDYSFIFQKI